MVVKKKSVKHPVHKAVNKPVHRAKKTEAPAEKSQDSLQPVAVREAPNEIVQERTEPASEAPAEVVKEEAPQKEEAPVEEESKEEHQSFKDFSIGNAIEVGWNSVKSNLLFFLGIFLFWSFVMLIGGFAKGTGTRIIVGLFQTGLSLGYLKVALDVVDGKKPEFKELFSCFSLLLKHIGASILYFLIVLMGTILLVIPGIVWSVEYGFYAFSIVSDKARPGAAIKKSGTLTDGVLMKLLLFALTLIGINILGVLALGIGVIITAPLSTIAAAHVYRQLEKTSEHS